MMLSVKSEKKSYHRRCPLMGSFSVVNIVMAIKFAKYYEHNENDI